MNTTKVKNWRLKSKEDRRFKMGHPWVYSNELQESPKGTDLGEWVQLNDASGNFLALGFGNPNSLIAFREFTRVNPAKEGEVLSDLLSGDEGQELVTTLFARKLKAALNFRQGWFQKAHSFRMVYGEVDGMSGLVIDRFSSTNEDPRLVQIVYVVQPHSAAMDRHLETVLAALKKVSKESGDSETSTLAIIRRDAGSREREGLTKIATEVRTLHTNEKVAAEAITALGEFEFTVPGFGAMNLSLTSDLISGQKTGFFFDQLQNIRLVESLVAQKYRASGKHGSAFTKTPARILDLCSYVGQWSAHLAQVFATTQKNPLEIICVDSSDAALHFAEANLSKVSAQTDFDITFRKLRGDVMEDLPAVQKADFDVVIADPPAFIKSRKSIGPGKQAYTVLFQKAIEATRSGGLVVCCSCSQLLSPEDMKETLAKAAKRSGRRVRWIAQGSPSVDHFSVMDFQEGMYLKCWVGEVTDSGLMAAKKAEAMARQTPKNQRLDS
jgi:23S rRNA (cytosine1962-C5)-methyltransferase